MGFLRKKKASGAITASGASQIAACLDLSPDSIEVALFERRAETAGLLGYAIQPLSEPLFLGTPDVAQKLKGVCLQALKTAKSNHSKPIGQLIMSVSGDLVTSVTQKTLLRRSQPQQPLQRGEIDQIITLNQAQALELAKENLSKTYQGEEELDLHLLNSSLIGFALDNKPIVNPLNQSASSIGIQVYNSFIDRHWLTTCQWVAAGLKLKLTNLAYKPFALARSLIGTRPGGLNTDALLIHIERRLTHLVVIKQELLIRSQHISFGTDLFDQALLREKSLAQKGLKGIKTASGDYDISQLKGEEYKAAARILNHTNSVWLHAVTVAIQDWKMVEVPRHIYVTGSGSNLSLIRKGLQRLGAAKVIPFQAGRIKIDDLHFENTVQSTAATAQPKANNLPILVGLAHLANQAVKPSMPAN